jgi:radical SAM protein with 4Fe4S-binding SPASM domain
MLKIYPKSFLIQWHITERCNLNCKHCYQNKTKLKDLKFEELEYIFNELKDLIDYFRIETKNPLFKAHINITGGEPFIRADFFKLLSLFHENKDYFSFGILSNGSFIDETNIKQLSKLEPKFVQLSLEGDKVTNDLIRGKGNFDATIKVIKILKKEKIPVVISFTANKLNYTKFKEVALLGKKLGVKKVWFDRMIPYGNAKDLKKYLLNAEETKNFFMNVKKIKSELERGFFNKTEIAMDRALQFLIDNKKPYKCNAGYSLITIQANGDLVPCRRMPIVVGNILNKNIKKMYLESKVFCGLRDSQNCDSKCKDCIYFSICRGGLRCLSYALFKNPHKRDPGCWLN